MYTCVYRLQYVVEEPNYLTVLIPTDHKKLIPLLCYTETNRGLITSVIFVLSFEQFGIVNFVYAVYVVT